jgi:uncharacterized repeat protein (TIGR01451 family)
MNSIDFGNEDCSNPNSGNAFSPPVISRLVLIDSQVEDLATLISGVKPGTEAIVLDPNRDGIEQIANILGRYSHLESVHIVSHGQPGRVDLGTGQLRAETFERYICSLQQWARAIAPLGEIWFYGCRVAAEEIGASWVRQVREMTQRAIVASSTLTGNAARGGNWEFEVTTGSRPSDRAFGEGAIAAYRGLLDTRTANVLYGANGNSILSVNVDNATTEQLGTLSFSTLAISREAETGLVYYLETIPAGVGNQVNTRVATWNPETGVNTILGTLGGDNPDAGLLSLRGVFVKMAQAAPNTRNPAYQNQLFALTSTPDVFIIDRNTGAARFLGTISTRPGENESFRGGGGDAAFDPRNPELLYVSDVTGGGVRLFRVNINTLEARFVGDTGLRNIDAGALAFGENGRLYLGTRDSLYEVALSDASTTLIGAVGVNLTDFATLPVPTPQVDLQITNTDNLETINIGETITYTITVTNPGTLPPNPPRDLRVCDLEGIEIEDLIPPGIRVQNFQSAIEGEGEVVTATVRNNILQSQVNLNAGSSVTFTITGTVTGGAANTLTNTASVRPPDGIVLFGNPPDNSVSAIDTTEATVPENIPPIAQDDSAQVDRGATVGLPVLKAEDSDGSIVNYTITALPSATQGIVLLDGEPVEVGQILTPDRADDLIFQAGATFSSARLQFTATDNRGATSNTATVALFFDNLPPETQNAKDRIKPGQEQPLSGLEGSDPDGSISAYQIKTVPPEEQGQLRLGGTPVVAGQNLTPEELVELTFAASEDFSGTTFEYAAIDDLGAIDPTPATVTLEVLEEPPGEGVKPPSPPPEPELPGRGTIVNNIQHVGCPPLPSWFDSVVEPPEAIDRSTLGLPGSTIVGAPNDLLVGRAIQGDAFSGGNGDDVLVGGVFSPVPLGADIDLDWLAGNEGRDWIAGSPGNDTVYGGKDDDTAFGGKDNDRMYGDRGSDVLFGDLGDDFIAGDSRELGDGEFSGSDRLEGGGGNDTLNGNEKDDTLTGGLGDDLVQGGQDNDRVFGDEGNDTVSGDRGNDTLLGSRGSSVSVGANGDRDLLCGNQGTDVIKGGEGEDLIYAGRDDDLVYGGKDNDLIFGDLGNDTLSGDLGNDTVVGGNGNPDRSDDTGNDLIFGGAGNDLLKGNAGNDSISSGEGDDTTYGGQDDDRIRGEAGNDRVFGDLGNDWLCGGDGNDTLAGSNGVPGSLDDGNDTLAGGNGEDLLWGNEGDDLLGGGAGNDSLFGGRGNDAEIGEAGDDLLCGDLGNDSLDGGDGNDTLVGSNGIPGIPGDGNDTLVGGNGDDLMFGNEQDDILGAGNGNDVVFGGQGNDAIAAEAGNDLLYGDLGDDLISGGTGADVFVLAANTGTDTIVDFEVGVDLLGLSGGLTFEDLAFTQEEGTTIVRFGDASIARLSGVSSDRLGAENFLAL